MCVVCRPLNSRYIQAQASIGPSQARKSQSASWKHPPRFVYLAFRCVSNSPRKINVGCVDGGEFLQFPPAAHDMRITAIWRWIFFGKRQRIAKKSSSLSGWRFSGVSVAFMTRFFFHLWGVIFFGASGNIENGGEIWPRKREKRICFASISIFPFYSRAIFAAVCVTTSMVFFGHGRFF